MSPKRIIHDPEFGDIEVPERPPISKAEWNRTLHRIQGRMRSQRLWKKGHRYPCPECGNKTFVGQDDLVVRFAARDGVHVFHHIHGVRCESCGAQTMEPYEQLDIEEEVGARFKPDYEGKITRIGRGTLGTYWPKDVERVMELAPDKRVMIKVLNRDEALIRLLPPDASRRRGRRTGKARRANR